MPEFDKQSEMALDSDSSVEPTPESAPESVKDTPEASAPAEADSALETPAPESTESAPEAPVAAEAAPCEEQSSEHTETPAPEALVTKAPARRGRRGGGFKGVSAAAKKADAAAEAGAMVEVSGGTVAADAISQRIEKLGDAAKAPEGEERPSDSPRSRERREPRGGRRSEGGSERRERPRRENSRSRKPREGSSDKAEGASSTEGEPEAKREVTDRFVTRPDDAKSGPKSGSRKGPRKSEPKKPVRMDFTQKPKSEGFFASVKSAIGKLFGGKTEEKKPAAPAKKGPRSGDSNRGPRSGGKGGPRGRGRGGPRGERSGNREDGGRPHNREGNGRRRGPRRRGGNRGQGSGPQAKKSEVES